MLGFKVDLSGVNSGNGISCDGDVADTLGPDGVLITADYHFPCATPVSGQVIAVVANGVVDYVPIDIGFDSLSWRQAADPYSPTISTVEPSIVYANTRTLVRVTGAHLTSVASVDVRTSLGQSWHADSLIASDDNALTAVLRVPETFLGGPLDAVISTFSSSTALTEGVQVLPEQLRPERYNLAADQEVVAEIAPAGLVMPDGDSVCTVDELEGGSDSVLAALAAFGVERISRVCPSCDMDDTLRYRADGFPLRHISFARVYRFLVPRERSRDSLVSALQEDELVSTAGANSNTSPNTIPTDPYFASAPQWGLLNPDFLPSAPQDIDIAPAWTLYSGSGSPGKIGIIDLGGIDASHPDFGLASGSPRVTGATGSNTHATNMAGIAAARGNNGTGIAGVHWNSLVFAGVIGDLATTAQAIQDAVGANSRVLNHSWHTSSTSGEDLLATAFITAYNAGALSCIAVPEVGQTGDNPNLVSGFGIMNVGSYQRSGSHSATQVSKSYVDIGAPGGNTSEVLAHPEKQIWTTNPGGGYGPASGTSAATALTTGVAALLEDYARVSLSKSLCSSDLKNILKLSARPVPTDSAQWFGTGKLDAYRALYLLGRTSSKFYNVVEPTNSYQVDVSGTHVTGLQFTGHTAVNIDGQTLPTGSYQAERYRIRSISSWSNYTNPVTWGDGEFTIGYPKIGNDTPYNSHNGSMWCEPLHRNLVSADTVDTYVYDISKLGGTHMGWWPCEPSEAVIAIAVIDTAGLSAGAKTAGLDDGLRPAVTTLRVGPTPTRGSCEFALTSKAAGRARISVYGVDGRKIRDVLDGPVVAGPRTVNWDLKDARGQVVGGGVYFYRATIVGEDLTGKLVIVR